ISQVALAVYVASFLLGMCSATTNATGMTFFSNVTGASHRGTSMAIFSAALLGGQAIGPAAAGLIASVGGWRFAMFVGTAAAGIVGLVLLTAGSSRPSPQNPVRSGDVGLADQGSRALLPLLVLQSVSFAVFLTLGSVSQTMVPIIGADDLGLGTAAIGIALGVGGLARFVGTLVGGRLSDRLARKYVLVPGLLVQALGVALLSLNPTVTLWVTAILIMSLASFAVPVAATILGDITDPARVGRQLGRFRFVGDLGLITGPLVVTSLFAGFGRAVAFLFVAGILTTAALVAWRYLPETRGAHGQGSA
ncbi:MAG TPA: MFS transporter, partial [Acidimicrobiia bacterium]|nr:MFS transporter [Acidimicrobiia bacterium]